MDNIVDFLSNYNELVVSIFTFIGLIIIAVGVYILVTADKDK
ncbi:hypothetical protein [Candidatus Clostridium radicumherbarum]|uniref:Uncharacterized protein n=1 Tax=Candidatus Clostridium radicumherbarum TaxID=3381662 RepID=A0ABW8TRZ5_9CLOT